MLIKNIETQLFAKLAPDLYHLCTEGCDGVRSRVTVVFCCQVKRLFLVRVVFG